MKKKKKKILKIFIIILAVIVVLLAAAYIYMMNPFNIGIYPLITPGGQVEEEADAGRRLEITFNYNKQRMIASSQFAFWIEDMDGKYIETIYVTQWTAKGGFSYRPHSIPHWVSVAKPGEMSPEEVDAISGATPRSGDYMLIWDFTDRNGNMVTGTQYRFFIEGTMNNDDTVLYSGIINIGGESWEEYPTPMFSIQDSEYKNMITNVRVAFFPG